ncbi:uncharacterized protein LOC118477395 [Aplysia californica]|uniref:Uncharacterized protein LOC118477395 n=1 Tax=Aplysia californica TaxID=6500 RepID=A0ABM1VQH6_APLCA|nr:uncharacterized protein LOC118477395 [Aplysia californica]
MTRCSPYIISSNLAVCIWMMIIPTVRSTLDFHDYKLQGLGNITENIGKDKVAGYFMLPHIYRVFINAGSSREAMDSTKVSKKCQNILHNYRKALSEKDVAAWKMYDATGKQPSGVLFGGTAWKSSYDQCVVEVLKDKSADSKSVSLSPQFCAVYMSSAPWIPSLVKAFKVPFSMQVPSFFVDVCVPKLCSKSDIFNLVDAFLKRNTRDRNVTVESVSCQYSHQITKDPAALISVLVLCFFLLMTLLGSLYEFIVKWHDDWGEECTSDEWIWPVGNKMPEGVLSWFLVSKIAQQLRPKSLSEVEVIKVVQWEDDSLEESLPRFIEDQKNEADGRSSRRKSRVSFHFSDKPYRQKLCGNNSCFWCLSIPFFLVVEIGFLASAIRNNTRQSRRSIAAESKLSEKSSLTPGFLDARRLTAKPGSFELRPSHRIKRYVASAHRHSGSDHELLRAGCQR